MISKNETLENKMRAALEHIALVSASSHELQGHMQVVQSELKHTQNLLVIEQSARANLQIELVQMTNRFMQSSASADSFKVLYETTISAHNKIAQALRELETEVFKGRDIII
jgi:hypothetical protein